MRTGKNLQTPIMTNSESVLQFGPNAYAKPATGLNILRETILGRELFDYAFKEYARRWAYKHPTPADFFRTMEDASGTDLDWFWRGWFYTTDASDLAITGVKWYSVDSKNPEIENARKRELINKAPQTLSQQRNLQDIKRTLVDEKPELKDFYNTYDPLATTDADKQRYQQLVKGLSPEQQKRLNAGLNFYEVSLKNVGGLTMPVIVQMTYQDGKQEKVTIPAEIWRKNNAEVTKVFITEKPVVSFVLDPNLETADIDLSNNAWPQQAAPSRFELFEQQQRTQPNPMQQQTSLQKMEQKPAGSSTGGGTN